MELVGIECEEIRSKCLCEKPLVSVWCLAYNFARYLKDCFEGILSQQVDFMYEIVVFDDDSSDGTSDIIRQYCNRYPQIFRAFIAKENSYKHPNRPEFMSRFPEKYLRGKYIAVCEGDDCWTDNGKLQIQVEFLRQHPECTLTMHNAMQCNIQTGCESKMKMEQFDRWLNIDEIIMQHDGMWPTASMVGKKDIFIVPTDLFRYGIGDWPVQLYAADKGKVYYFNKSMSVYRYMVDGSWSATTYGSSLNRIQYIIKMLNLLKVYNEYTHKKYEKTIYKRINKFFSSIIDIYEQTDDEFDAVCKGVSINSDFDSKVVQEIIEMRQRYQEGNFSNQKLIDLLAVKLNVDVIFIFCASTAGKRMHKVLNHLNVEVLGFLDNDRGKWGTQFDGELVYPLDSFLDVVDDKKYMIMVSSVDYDALICEQLKASGYNYISAEEFFDAYFEISQSLLD